jgi:alpha-L-fucosidase 2
LDTPLTITLLPALPDAWAASGSIKGVRVRGALGLDMAWKGGKLTKATLKGASNAPKRKVRVVVGNGGKVVKEFESGPGVLVNVV